MSVCRRLANALAFFSPCAGLKRPTLRSSFCIKWPLHDNYVGFWFCLRWSATFSPKHLWDGAASLIWSQLWYDLVQLYHHTKSGKNKKNSIRWDAMIDVMMNKSKKCARLSVNVATFVFGCNLCEIIVSEVKLFVWTNQGVKYGCLQEWKKDLILHKVETEMATVKFYSATTF